MAYEHSTRQQDALIQLWSPLETETLLTLLKDDNEKLRRHSRWALICEVNAGYESSPDTRDELEKMRGYHEGLAQFAEANVEVLLAVLQLREWGASNLRDTTQEDAADANGEGE